MLQRDSKVPFFIALAVALALLVLMGVVAMILLPSNAMQSSAVCTEYDHHDRKLPNSYRLRVLTTCVYRIKWGPDFMILPTTGTNGEHGILEIAIIGNTVVGPVIDSTTPNHAIVGWFWLDTDSREFKDKLTKDELAAILKSKAIAMPDYFLPVESLPDYPWGG